MIVFAGCSGSADVDSLPLTADQLENLVPKELQPPPQTEPGLADPDAPEEFTVTETGLKYRILRRSDKRKPDLSDSVYVHYKGTLDNGSVFDSTYSRGQPAVFALANVISGWKEGLPLIGVGGMIELELPPELGYGEAGHGANIPPNATLHFIVELLRIQSGDK